MFKAEFDDNYIAGEKRRMMLRDHLSDYYSDEEKDNYGRPKPKNRDYEKINHNLYDFYKRKRQDVYREQDVDRILSQQKTTRVGNVHGEAEYNTHSESTSNRGIYYRY